MRLVARVQRTKLSEGLLEAGWGAMSHVSALKKETGAEWRVAGAKVSRSQRRDLQSQWQRSSGGIFIEGFQ